MELAARKEKILSAIVESYIGTGEPVGSKTLIAETGLKISSATVRNEMADLADRGYIVQPHTSAGRIPTQLGFRYYIDHALSVKPMSQSGRDYIRDELSKSDGSPEELLSESARLLAKLTGFVSLATTPDGESSRVRRLSFVQTGAHSAMVVLIASNGVIKTRLFRCGFLITPEILGVFDKALNEVFAGVKLSSVNRPMIQTTAARFGELSLFMPEVLTAILDTASAARNISVCRSGTGHLMAAAESGFGSARALLELLNSEIELANMLSHLPPDTAVTLGRENSRVELAASAVVSARYSIAANPSGVLAVIGPLRMDYGRIISIINCVSECVGDLISELVRI